MLQKIETYLYVAREIYNLIAVAVLEVWIMKKHGKFSGQKMKGKKQRRTKLFDTERNSQKHKNKTVKISWPY